MKRFGISTRDFGLAIIANRSDCYPHDVIPVESLTGETVAAICSKCLDEVPVAWLTHSQPPPPPPPGRNPAIARRH